MQTPGLSLRGGYRALIVLPPDFDAPEAHRPYRFPRQGPAIVAAAIAQDGIVSQVVDLDLDLSVFSGSPTLLTDADRLAKHLGGETCDEYVAFGNDLIERITQLADLDIDAFAISIDRHTQGIVSALLGIELKRRFGLPVILGGASAGTAAEHVERLAARGIDFITRAETPHEIRAAFAALREIGRDRWEIARDPVAERIATPPDDWPVPDFSVYDLDSYRRDPFLVEPFYHHYDRSIGRRLMLPYHFSWDCQYACTFCARGGTQTAKSIGRVVRDLAILAERYDCRDFMFFDAQINLFANDLAKQLIDARLELQWTDSFRVTPRKPPEVLERMARAGCVGLTFGVESASDRMLKRMVKGHSSAQATSVIRDAHANEMFVRVNLLPCFPGETREDHDATVRWVMDYAECIDEVVPSSFYLASNSPVLELTERYGITVRERRLMQGDYKFRKNYGSLALDEIGGYSWEERERMLRPAEDELRTSWAHARAGKPALFQPSQIFALRRAYASKQECYAALERWDGPLVDSRTPIRQAYDCSADQPIPEQPSAIMEDQLISPASSLGTTQSRAASSKPVAALPPTADSSQALALAAIAEVTAALGLQSEWQAADAHQLAIVLRDSQGASLSVIIEPNRDGGHYYRHNDALGLWYLRDEAKGTAEPPWTIAAIDAIAKLLLSGAFNPVAVDLANQPPSPAQSIAPPTVDAINHFPRYTVFDLVRLGLKPAAALPVATDEDADRLARGQAATALSRFRFGHDQLDDLVIIRDSQQSPPNAKIIGKMMYVGKTQAEVDQLRDLDEAIYVRNGCSEADSEGYHESFGRGMGFPSCCVAKFVKTFRQLGQHGDYYASLVQLGWHLRPIDWRLNFIIARQYGLPILIHTPCSADCAATVAMVESVVGRLYQGQNRRTLESILSQGVVIYPDDRFILFRIVAAPDHDGVVRVADFNRDAHAEIGSGQRALERSVPPDPTLDFSEREIEAVRVRGGRLQVYARNAWSFYTSHDSAGREPVVLTPTNESALLLRDGLA